MRVDAIGGLCRDLRPPIRVRRLARRRRNEMRFRRRVRRAVSRAIGATRWCNCRTRSRGIDSTSTSAISSCAKANPPCRRSSVGRSKPGERRLRDRESHRRLAARAGANEQTERRTRRPAMAAVPSTACVLDENLLNRCAISAARPLGKRSSETGRPLPAASAVPDRAVLDERAEQLRDEQRIALGVAIEKRQELASDLLPVERRLEPLLHLVARQIATA